MVRRMQAVADPGLLFEDRNGALWVGTDALSRFDPATGAFTPVVKPRTGTETVEREAITGELSG